MSECKYFTTPIFYASGKPHAGHFYTTIIMNILCKHNLLKGNKALGLTGLDEHGEKVAIEAAKNNLDPQSYVNNMDTIWRTAMADLSLEYDIFQRTTDPKHLQNVQDILKYCHAKGDIYFGTHNGLYCVGCEDFLKAEEIDADGCCLTHKTKCENRSEGNYFFRTSKYKEQVKQLILAGKIVDQPRYQNELLGMLDQLEGDLSISRPKTRTTWGVEIPFDKEHVTYVWFDALPNYVTGIGGINEARHSEYWKNCVHIIGKDILKFHGIFWPAMCLSLDIPVAKLLVNGWILSGSHKMSKSLGNVINLQDIQTFGKDAFVNILFRTAPLGEDLDISQKTFLERFNADLANGIGNLLSRTLGMLEKYTAKSIPKFAEQLFTEEDLLLANQAKNLPTEVCKLMDNSKLSEALVSIWQLIASTDKYISDNKPWLLAKDTSPAAVAKLNNVLAHAIACLRVTGYLAYPYFPLKMQELLQSLGENTENMLNAYAKLSNFYAINSSHVFADIPKLFQRIDLKSIETESTNVISSNPETNSPQKQPLANTAPSINDTKTPTPTNLISIDEFSKTEIKIGTVVQAEIVEGSTKLLKLQVSLGEMGIKQIFAGIREWILPEEIVNRKVLVVANLAPRKMKFGISEGMVLAAESESGVIKPIFVPDTMKEGAKLS